MRDALPLVRPRIDDAWLELLDGMVEWDEEGEVCLSDGVLEQVPTVLVSDEAPSRMIDAGFAGVVSTDAEPEQVLIALEAAAAGLVVYQRADAGFPETPHLTDREREVLELLAQGFSNREIGAELGISAHTAKFHVQGLLDKLDATTRTEAAVRAARMLLI